VAVLTLDRPPANALVQPMCEELSAHLANLAVDDEVRVVVLTGAGRIFCGGEDLNERQSIAAGEWEARVERMIAFFASIASYPLPLVLAINGSAAGGGVCFAGIGDYRIASSDAVFTMPEINIGAVGAGGVFLRMLGVPEGAIRLMHFSGSCFDAQQVAAWHLVDEVCSPAAVLDRAMAVAASFALHPKEALRLVKQGFIEASMHAYWLDGARSTISLSVEAAAKRREGAS
jgi:enoyl-CoA hydratase